MARRSSSEALAWGLFSAGGMVSALLVPVLLLLFGVVYPLGLVEPPEHSYLLAVLTNPNRWSSNSASCWAENARVRAAGGWRGLHTVGVRDSLEAINGIGHAAVMTDPGGRVLGQPADDLGRGTILRGVVRLRDLRVQRGRDRPCLRPVDGDLDESHRLVVMA